MSSSSAKTCSACGKTSHPALVCIKRRRDKKATNSRKLNYLTRQQEIDLGKRWRKHKDQKALDELVLAFYPGLVLYVAKKFQNFFPIEDLLQEGSIGLLMAALKYEPERGLRFYTYAIYWVRAYILNYTLRMGHVVRFGTRRADRHILFGLAKAQHKLELKGEATLEALAAELGASEEDVVLIRNRAFGVDVPLDKECGENSVLEAFFGEEAKQEEEIGENEVAQQQRKMLQRALRKLGVRERRIVQARYMLERTKTLQELADEFNLSRERVRQLEVRALKKLKGLLRDDYESLAA